MARRLHDGEDASITWMLGDQEAVRDRLADD